MPIHVLPEADHDRFVDAYDRHTGAKVRVPRQWVEDGLFPNLRKTPLARKAEGDKTGTPSGTGNATTKENS